MFVNKPIMISDDSHVKYLRVSLPISTSNFFADDFDVCVNIAFENFKSYVEFLGYRVLECPDLTNATLYPERKVVNKCLDGTIFSHEEMSSETIDKFWEAPFDAQYSEGFDITFFHDINVKMFENINEYFKEIFPNDNICTAINGTPYLRGRRIEVKKEGREYSVCLLSKSL